jgi:uncharacterized protein (UPF0218 family)
MHVIFNCKKLNKVIGSIGNFTTFAETMVNNNQYGLVLDHKTKRTTNIEKIW